METDVVIIGAGPAGSNAACHLADSGLEVLLIEASAMPRYKACGGLMPNGVQRLIPADISHLVSHRVQSFQFFNNFEHGHRVKLDDAELLLVERAQFDAGLAHTALALGNGRIRILENQRVIAIRESNDEVVVETRAGQAITAGFLVAADGAMSKSARCLGLSSAKAPAIALDALIRVNPQCYSRFAERVIFNYFCLPGGYGWVFPKGGQLLSCGIMTRDQTKKGRPELERFIERTFVTGEIESIQAHGYPIPVYDGQRDIATQRACLCGDAAVLVDPISGEGIRFALASGKLAAQTVCDIRSGKVRDCRDYQQRVFSQLIPILEHTLRFAVLPFMNAPDLYYRRFITGAAGLNSYHSSYTC